VRERSGDLKAPPEISRADQGIFYIPLICSGSGKVMGIFDLRGDFRSPDLLGFGKDHGIFDLRGRF
jgi:hypothetical protein